MGVPQTRARSERAGTAFVGRRAQLRALRAALRAAAAGRGAVMLVGGEPGAGKTSLVERLVARAPGAGVAVRWTTCHDGAPSFWPWIELVRGLRDAPPPELASPEPDAEAAAGRHEHDRFLLFSRAASFLRAAAEGQPLLLVIDDLHCADVASLLLLEFLAREVRSSRILVVGTYRDVEIGASHPLGDVLDRLAGAGHHLVLHGLTPSEVADLAAQLTGSAPDAGTVAALHERTGGNPLFLRELLWLAGQGERWDEVVPDAARDVILRRLRRLSGPCRAMLDVAAVVGQQFRLRLMEAVSDLSEEELTPALDEAVRARLLEPVPGGVPRFRFVHALMREALYRGLDAGDRRRLHGRTADAIERVFGDGLEHRSAQLAHHLRMTEDPARHAAAAAHAVDAGRLAVRHLAYEGAIGHFEDALDLLGTARPARSCEVLLELAGARMRAGQIAAGRAAYGRAAAAARAAGDAGALAAAALGVGVGTTVGVVDDLEIRLLDEALGVVGESDAGLRTRLLGRLATALHSTSSLGPRMALSDQAVAAARRLEDPGALAATLLDRNNALATAETVESRLAMCDEAVRLAVGEGDHALVLRGRTARMGVLLELGRIDELRVELEICDGMTRELRLPQFAWRVLLVRSSQAALAGRLEEAEALAVEALEAGRRVQYPGIEVYQLAVMAVIRHLQGRMGELEEPLRAMVAGFPDVPDWRCSLALSLCHAGRIEEARAEFDLLAAEDFAALPRSVRPSALATLSLVCDALGDARRAGALHARLLPHAGSVVPLGLTATGCLGAASLYLGMLSCSLERWEEARRHLQAAIGLNGRMDARPWVAASRLQHARALRGIGHPDALACAEDEVRRAEETSRALGLRLWPGGVHGPVAASPLSRRELEVARLVADGLGNREIAERLFISKRTAETHVENIRRKIGAGSRNGIVSWVLRHPEGA